MSVSDFFDHMKYSQPYMKGQLDGADFSGQKLNGLADSRTWKIACFRKFRESLASAFTVVLS